MPKLTLKQQRFVDEYLIDLNATQAAIRAGYSKKTANEQGARLLAKVSVQSAIQDATKRRQVRTEITQDRVLTELAKIAFSNKKDLMSWSEGGTYLKSSDELTDDQAAAVAEVYSSSHPESGTTTRIKTHDKVAALKLLGDHLGMFRQRVELTGEDGKAIVTVQLTEQKFTEIAKKLTTEI